jgi:hypothetical protein
MEAPLAGLSFTSAEIEASRAKVAEILENGVQEVEIDGRRVKTIEPLKYLEALERMNAINSNSQSKDGGILKAKFVK